ncbi:MBL fold metallo-hydrolase [Corynebacterium pygosceleis]|uniref:MBL fold metallo-hydrolase n=1 Tax=Corynebacterium pygosceleis TaxID=2800406 RepID=A0A9Q4GK08_9CORY|nr:MBL fold metallo-hydrolase [Corynebacterium pygosceleis]MCK7636939.1 MBL fold metallo-hydrolase [Corynebacterium pygosceleis]MCK7674413.1 MBL fold metallo-hydrolase [Corynebacterium pygosceleis]MCL0120289.1 MBL fold metallo-hydrolase [Corynebacterium pygosceleis]MCX7443836.1 MBL fold metallo-hydrolase [Corynebacterium pygosceleis]MCX7467692.1 MBL fold metallo-hydrolase [Corynebacterium pygosceleis]
MEILGFAAGPYQTNTWLLVGDGRCVVIDPGMHAARRVVEILDERDLTLESVVLTHGHIDHTRDSGTLANRFGVPVHIHPDDRMMLDDPSTGVSAASVQLFTADRMPRPAEVGELTHGACVRLAGTDFTVRHAPGHSPGSVLLVGAGICVSGDVLFRGAVGRTDLPASDPRAMDRTLRNEVLALDDRLQVLPGHGPVTTMRAERRSNPFLLALGRN